MINNTVYSIKITFLKNKRKLRYFSLYLLDYKSRSQSLMSIYNINFLSYFDLSVSLIVWMIVHLLESNLECTEAHLLKSCDAKRFSEYVCVLDST